MQTIPERFQNGKHVGSYAGLSPKQYQSGQMERQGGISGQGNRLLRNLLIEISWSSVRHNRWARDTYKKLLRGSKSRKVNFTFAFLSPPHFLAKAAKADYGEIEKILV